MQLTTILPASPTAGRLEATDLLQRPIHFAPGLDYDALVEQPLDRCELDQTSVLSAAAERLLFAQMNLAYFRAADVRARIAKQAATPDELAELEYWLTRGDGIRNAILLVFRKLTVSVARQFVCARHSLEELVSEGTATLVRTIALFDPSRGFRFSTYATHALRRRLFRYIHSAQHRHAVPVDFREAPPISDSRRWTVGYQQAMEAGVQWLEGALYELSPRERYILRCRFGWGREFEPRTLQQIAEELGVSRERVRQLETRAIARLRELASERDLLGL